jgi:hypothetical protein
MPPSMPDEVAAATATGRRMSARIRGRQCPCSESAFRHGSMVASAMRAPEETAMLRRANALGVLRSVSGVVREPSTRPYVAPATALDVMDTSGARTARRNAAWETKRRPCSVPKRGFTEANHRESHGLVHSQEANATATYVAAAVTTATASVNQVVRERAAYPESATCFFSARSCVFLSLSISHRYTSRSLDQERSSDS